MTFTKFLPVALLIGALAAFSVILTAWFAVAVWPIFISWGMYFLAGAKPSRLHKEVIGLTGGIAFGYLTLFAAPYYASIFGATWGLPLTVFTVASIIVLLELTDWLELAPAYFLSYAAYFAYVFGNFGGAGTTAASALVPFWILTMVGLVFGVVSGYLRKKILEGEGIFGAMQETVFDKERKN
ncbi:MAG TPA: DUF1097 domain-containing protein [Candidatus Paceibacterota bacterium]|nr:DUF1097 domain-containing protein [Candidatus Paceibacterota bacterium]